jgi:hypothetical protein
MNEQDLARHSRAGGNPASRNIVDSRFRGNDPKEVKHAV